MPARPATGNYHPQYRPDIDGLRALAVLPVVLFHAFPTLLKGGFVGVDIFFVISGFLISTIIFRSLQQGAFNLADFYRHRVRRIFPPLLLVLIGVYAVAWIALLPEDFQRLGTHVLGGATFIQNIVLFREAGYFDAASELKPLMHLWSLAVEEQFYLLYPLMIGLAWRFGVGLSRTLAALFLTSFVLNVHTTWQDTTAAFFLPHTRLWELLGGALLSWWTLQQGTLASTDNNTASGWQLQLRKMGEWRNTLSTLGLMLILWSILGIRRSYHFPGWWALVPVSGALLLIAGGPHAWINRMMLASRPMTWIGLISYPLYLWHWPLLSLANILLPNAPSQQQRIIIVLVSVALAWLTFVLVERPIRRHIPIARTWIPLTASMAVMAVVGVTTYTMKGLEFRFRGAAQLAQIIDYQWYETLRYGHCYLHRVAPDDYTAECDTQQRPSVVLWGDSHAASLYPGLIQLQQRHGFGVAQYTAAGCPPILDSTTFRKNCNDINRKVIDKLVRNKPDLLLMSSAFNKPEFNWTDAQMLQRFSATLDLLHERLPATRIVIVGPVPEWEHSAQRSAYQYWTHSANKTALTPQRLPAIVSSGIDAGLRSITQSHGDVYISAIDILCNAEGCINRVGTAPADYITIDYGHLSPAGSRYFMNAVSSVILTSLPSVNHTANR
jgi:peptidoglycan/LPS O-acetylase OafA/YrhL